MLKFLNYRSHEVKKTLSLAGFVLVLAACAAPQQSTGPTATSTLRPTSGSQVQGQTGSLGLAILVMMVGSIGSIVALAYLLGQLSRAHDRLLEARGDEPSQTPLLEMVLVITATVAVVGFVLWFFVVAGPGPQIAPSK